jgi:hypothetical protein
MVMAWSDIDCFCLRARISSEPTSTILEIQTITSWTFTQELATSRARRPCGEPQGIFFNYLHSLPSGYLITTIFGTYAFLLLIGDGFLHICVKSCTSKCSRPLQVIRLYLSHRRRMACLGQWDIKCSLLHFFCSQKGVQGQERLVEASRICSYHSHCSRSSCSQEVPTMNVISSHSSQEL